MIVTVTLNPAVDKTVEIDRLIMGGLNRIGKINLDAGGKGINVSKTIRELGGESIATGFLGGASGKRILSVLEENGIPNDFLWVDGETRINTKVVESDGTVTELNELGPKIGEEQTEQLLQKLKKYMKKGTLIVLSGSAPKGMDVSIYAKMIRMAHEGGAEVLLDADGALFRNALVEKPDILKPNCVELEDYAGWDHSASMDELLALAQKLNDCQTKTVVVSMGAKGALFVRGAYQAFSPALQVKTHSTVGAGDAMVAALAYAWEKELGNEETFRLCMAVSAGAVMTIGTKPPARDIVNELSKKVMIREI